MRHFIKWNAELCSQIIGEQIHLQGAMLSILHALQGEFGFIHQDAIPLIAKALNISKADVHGVITFYHDFRHTPPPKKVVKLCRAEACQSVGCETLVEHLSHHNVHMDVATANGNLSVETIYCLGNCALGPSALVDGELYGRVDAHMLDELCELTTTNQSGAHQL